MWRGMRGTRSGVCIRSYHPPLPITALQPLGARARVEVEVEAEVEVDVEVEAEVEVEVRGRGRGRGRGRRPAAARSRAGPTRLLTARERTEGTSGAGLYHHQPGSPMGRGRTLV